MHGLINKSLQSFFIDTFGAAAWQDIAARSGITQRLGTDGFEAMRLYDDALTHAMLDAASTLLRRPRDSLLEDLGTYLVSHERMEALRRLLRFGGVSFTDFLFCLDDLQGRSRLAVPDLALPDFVIDEGGPGRFTLRCRGGPPGFGHVMTGILRALADDYGALVVLDHSGNSGGDDCIDIILHDPAHHAGRAFHLAAETR
jgi:hypothetical protein